MYKQKSSSCFKEGGINFTKILKHIKLKELELIDRFFRKGKSIEKNRPLKIHLIIHIFSVFE